METQFLPAFQVFFGFLGLIGSTAYDVADFNNATGNVHANITTFAVDCRTVAKVKWASECNG